MRHAMPLLFTAVFLLGSAHAADLKPEDAIKSIRDIDLHYVPTEDDTTVRTERELLTFDQAKDDVIWVRTYKDGKITQVYNIVKDRAKVKDGEVIIPLKWESMANPDEKNYNADKHDVGLRVTKTDKGKWLVKFYSIDEKGVEVTLTFAEGKEE